MLDLTRRKFLVGLGLVGIAPAIVHASNIMRVRPIDPMDDFEIEPEVVWNQFTFRTSIPAATWRTYNMGVPYVKTPTSAIREPFQSFEDVLSRPLIERMSDILQTPDRKWFTLG